MSDEQNNQSVPRLQIDEVEGIAHVTFPRRAADGICVRELYEFAASLADQSKAKLHVDFRSLALVTSGMAGILIQAQKVLRQNNGQLHITVADELMYIQFKTMHMHELLNLFHSVDEAVGAFN